MILIILILIVVLLLLFVPTNGKMNTEESFNPWGYYPYYKSYIDPYYYSNWSYYPYYSDTYYDWRYWDPYYNRYLWY